LREYRMNIKKSNIVRAIAGRDMGKCFFVTETNGEYAMIADGGTRKLEKPKRKKLKHLRLENSSESRTAIKIQCGVKVSNSELRRALAEFSAGPDGGQGGM